MKILILAVLTIGFTGCAYFGDVRPGNNNVHHVVVTAVDKETGQRSAIRQANSYCEKKENNKSAVIIKEESKYTGDMEEKNYINARRASTAATVAGGGAAVFGKKKVKDVGGAVALGGVAGGAAIGKGYTVDMSFSCK